MNAIKHRLSHTSGLVGMGTKPSFMDTFKNSILFLSFTNNNQIEQLCPYPDHTFLTPGDRLVLNLVTSFLFEARLVEL